MRVKLNQRDRSVLFRYRAQDWQANRVVSTHANAPRSGLQKRRNSPLDAAEGVLDRKRIDGKIAEIASAVLGEGVHVQHRIPWPDNRRLCANVPWAKARPRAISRSAIEWHANQSNL